TPWTRLARHERVSPCSARVLGRSSGRVTRIWPSATETRTSSCISHSSVPLGPFTLTVEPSMVTSTPLGIGMGALPIRDMSGLPDVTEHFAADLATPGLTAGHHTLRRAHDRDPEASEDPRNLLLADVHAKPRAGDPPDAGDHRLAVIRVGDVQLQVVPRALGNVRDAAQEPFLLEHLRHGTLHLGGGHSDLLVVRGCRIADAREHVCQRIGCGHPQ